MFQGNRSLAQLLQVFGGKNIIGHGSHNLVLQEFKQQIVDVVAAEVRVTVGGKNLENVAFGGGNQLEDGNVEGAAAEIVDGDFAALLFVQAVGEGRSSWFVDEAENFEAGNFTGVLGGLALGIIEIRGNGDDSAVDGLAEMGVGPVFQLAENECGNFRRCEDFVAQQDADNVLARWIDAKWKEF